MGDVHASYSVLSIIDCSVVDSVFCGAVTSDFLFQFQLTRDPSHRAGSACTGLAGRASLISFQSSTGWDDRFP
jgi:hypothetical protein